MWRYERRQHGKKREEKQDAKGNDRETVTTKATEGAAPIPRGARCDFEGLRQLDAAAESGGGPHR
jgi:hypothetical protein